MHEQLIVFALRDVYVYTPARFDRTVKFTASPAYRELLYTDAAVVRSLIAVGSDVNVLDYDHFPLFFAP